MLRGFITTKCPNCGHKFKAPDIEDNATVLSAPVKCPACGHSFRPTRVGLIESLTGKAIK